MRRHRVALIVCTCIAALVAAAVMAGAFTASTASSSSTLASWQRPSVPAQPRTELLSNQSLEPIATFAAAVVAAEEANYLAAIYQANVRAASASQTSGSSSSTTTSGADGIPAAWWPTALCEEGGRDDPYAGYFGILEWNGFEGYPTAGSAPLDVQLAWESAHGIGPPDAPGQCHSY